MARNESIREREYLQSQSSLVSNLYSNVKVLGSEDTANFPFIELKWMYLIRRKISKADNQHYITFFLDILLLRP